MSEPPIDDGLMVGKTDDDDVIYNPHNRRTYKFPKDYFAENPGREKHARDLIIRNQV